MDPVGEHESRRNFSSSSSSASFRPSLRKAFFLCHMRREAPARLTCEDLPRFLLVVVVLDQVAGQAIRSRRQASNQQEHPLV